MNEVIKAPSKAIIATIERANREHKAATDQALQVRESVQASLTHAIKCGHGGFVSLFVASKDRSNATFGFGREHATKYMRAAKFPTQARIASESEESFSLDREVGFQPW